MKKYSRKLNNKKIKCSRKILKGGAGANTVHALALESALKYVPPYRRPNMTKTNTNKDKISKKFLSQGYYVCLNPIQEDVNIPNFEFEKYKCEYPKDDYFDAHSSYIYLKLIPQDEPLNYTVEAYRAYAPNNQLIGMEYKNSSTKDVKYKETGKLFDITLLELNVDIMQLAINTGKISISSDTQGNSYLGFIDFPSLIITDKPAGASFSFKSREYANWITVYEETFEEPEKFDLIETDDKKHIDKNKLEEEIKRIKHKIELLNMNRPKNQTELEKKEYDDQIAESNKELINLSTYKRKPVVKMSNKELFNMKKEELKTLLEKPFDEKDKTKIEEQVKYRTNTIKHTDNVISSNATSNATTELHITDNNMSWVMQNALWLEKYLELNTSYMQNKNKTDIAILNATELLKLIDVKYNCR